VISACVFESGDGVRGLYVFRVEEQIMWFALVEQLPVFTGVASDKEITIVVFVPLHLIKKVRCFLKDDLRKQN